MRRGAILASGRKPGERDQRSHRPTPRLTAIRERRSAAACVKKPSSSGNDCAELYTSASRADVLGRDSTGGGIPAGVLCQHRAGRRAGKRTAAIGFRRPIHLPGQIPGCAEPPPFAIAQPGLLGRGRRRQGWRVPRSWSTKTDNRCAIEGRKTIARSRLVALFFTQFPLPLRPPNAIRSPARFRVLLLAASVVTVTIAPPASLPRKNPPRPARRPLLLPRGRPGWPRRKTSVVENPSPRSATRNPFKPCDQGRAAFERRAPAWHRGPSHS